MGSPTGKSSLKGPRPPPLKKPPLSPPNNKQKLPVVIYTTSPKTIHIKAENFKELVQRLTGMPRPSSSSGEVSAATVEKANKSTKKKRQRTVSGEGIETVIPAGILSPAPAVSSNLFAPSPVHASFFHEGGNSIPNFPNLLPPYPTYPMPPRPPPDFFSDFPEFN